MTSGRSHQSLARALGVTSDHSGLIELSHALKTVQIPKGERLFASGDACEAFVLVLNGTVKVQLSTRTGRELVLFRLQEGQSCALTTSCILTDSPYYAEGIAETDIEILTFPSSDFVGTFKRYPDLFVRVVASYAERIAELTSVIDRLMSRDLNAELKALLIKRADANQTVYLSHQMIADELASSREVISRKLKALESAGSVKLGRGQITLLDLSS